MFDFPIIVTVSSESGISPELDTDKMDTMMSGAVCCVISSDDVYAAMSSTDGSVRVITMDGKYIYRLQQKSSAVAITFTPNNQTMLSAGYRSIYVWSMLDGSCKYVNKLLHLRLILFVKK